MKATNPHQFHRAMAAAAFFLLAIMASPALADEPDEPVNFNPNKITGNSGTSQITFTLSGVGTYTAYGYNTVVTSNTLQSTVQSTSTINLYYLGNNIGGSEYGLGVADSSHSYNLATDSNGIPLDFIQIDLENLKLYFTSMPLIHILGVQGTDSYTIWGSNTLGVLGTALASVGRVDSANESIQELDPSWTSTGGLTYRYYSVTATQKGTTTATVYLEGIAITAVPEPIAGGIFLLGGLILIGWRTPRRKSKAASL